MQSIKKFQSKQGPSAAGGFFRLSCCVCVSFLLCVFFVLQRVATHTRVPFAERKKCLAGVVAVVDAAVCGTDTDEDMNETLKKKLESLGGKVGTLQANASLLLRIFSNVL